MTHTQHFI